MKNTIKEKTGCLHCGKMVQSERTSPGYPFGYKCACSAWQCNKVLALIVWNDRYSIFENSKKKGTATDKELSPCPICKSSDVEFLSDGQYAHKVICKSCGYNK